MTRQSLPALEQLPLAIHHAIDRICTRFELAWQTGARPRLEPFLGELSPSEHAVLFRELLLVELEYRRRGGETPQALDYTRRFPEQAAMIEEALQPVTSEGNVPVPPARLALAAPPAPASRVRISVAGGSGLNMTAEIGALLLGRLRVVGLIVTAALVIAFVYFLLLLYAEVEQYSNPARDFVVWGLVILAVGLLTIWLWRTDSLPLTRLRIVELLLFGLPVALFCWFILATPPRWWLADAPPANVYYWIQREAESHVFFWFALVIAYSMFIPNTWQRCAVVAGTIVGVCLLANVVAVWDRPALGGSGGLRLVVLTIWGVISAAMAVFGCHRITVLEKEALRARRLGQYQLRERLGMGGMGEVYLAEHTLMKRPCPVKLIRPEHAGDPRVLRRFEREVQATGTLAHPNIVQIFDYGQTEDGTFYYVMEYLPA